VVNCQILNQHVCKATLFLFCCLTGSAQQTGKAIPDSIAYTALYHVVYDAPAPHWDRETCLSWLAERGLSGLQAQAVIFAANRYMAKHVQFEVELRTLNNETRNSLGSPAQARRNDVENRRSAEITASIKQLDQDVGPEGAAKVLALIQNVKSGINMKGSASK
jgi:hypothetical protein